MSSVDYGEIAVSIFVHVHEQNDVCIFVAFISFGEKAAWVYQASDIKQL